MKPLNHKGETEAEFLAAYDVSQYIRPSVATDIAVFTVRDRENLDYRKLPEKSLQLLLIKRKDHPYVGCWALPGGFVEPAESLDQAAQRELKEETNVDNIYLEQLYTWSDPNRDPRTRVISCSYLSLVDSSRLAICGGDDAEEAAWFSVSSNMVEENRLKTENGWHVEKKIRLSFQNEIESFDVEIVQIEEEGVKLNPVNWNILNPGKLAFDHGQIIWYAIERLRNKLDYTDIVFNLMPELFSLTELQQVYEIILGKELIKANFRRKISDKVQQTNHYTKDLGHRPSQLYKYNPSWNKHKDIL